MERFFSPEFLIKLNESENFEHQKKLAEITIENLCHVNNFVGTNGQSLTQYFDFLYKKPNQNTSLFSPIIGFMIEYDFFKLIKKIFRDVNNFRLLDSDNAARDSFIVINKIIISYADFSIEFRKNAITSQLVNVLVEIIEDDFNNVTNANDKTTECINIIIRALYNITRLNEMRTLFRKLRIPFILLERMNHINDQKTRVCAILCLGWTLNANDIETHSIGGLNLDVGLTISFSLLDRALQTGNNNSNNMFRCFLGQMNLLPFFWAYEICDGIAKLGEIENVRQLFSNRTELFKLLIEFYTRSISIQEKISASYAILVFSCETKFIEIVRTNSYFRELLLKDISQNELHSNLVQINLNLYFKVGLELELHLESANEFELKFKELSIMINNLITTYAEDKITTIYYKACQEILLRNTFHVVKEYSDSDRSKVLLLNLILKKVQQNFDKRVILKLLMAESPEIPSCSFNGLSINKLNVNSHQGEKIKEEIDLKHLIIICFILLEKALLEGKEDQGNFASSKFSAHEIAKKLGEWSEKNSIKEFILMTLIEKLELFLHLYNESHEYKEKMSACYVINLYANDEKFLKIIKDNKKFCFSLFKDLDKSNEMMDNLIEINYNLFDYTHIMKSLDEPDSNEIDIFNIKVKNLDRVLNSIEIKSLQNQDLILKEIDGLIIEVNQKSKNLINLDQMKIDIFKIETVLLEFSLLRIKKYLNGLNVKNQSFFPVGFNSLVVFNYFNDNYEEKYYTLKKMFPNLDEFNKVFKYFESTSSGSNCFLTKLLKLLTSISSTKSCH